MTIKVVHFILNWKSNLPLRSYQGNMNVFSFVFRIEWPRRLDQISRYAEERSDVCPVSCPEAIDSAVPRRASRLESVRDRESIDRSLARSLARCKVMRNFREIINPIEKERFAWRASYKDGSSWIIRGAMHRASLLARGKSGMRNEICRVEFYHAVYFTRLFSPHLDVLGI